MACSPITRRALAPGSRRMTGVPASLEAARSRAPVRRWTVRRMSPSAPLAPPWAADMEDTMITTSSVLGPQHVGIGRRVDAPVDVLGAADHDRAEVAGDGARREHGVGQAGRSGDPARPNTTRAPSVRRTAQMRRPSGQRSPMSSSSPRARSVMSIWPLGTRVMAATSGRKARGRRATRATSAGDGQVPGPQHARARTEPAAARCRSGRIRRRMAPPVARGGHAVERRGQVRRRDTHAQSGAGDRTGRGADDDLGVARIPADLALERGQHAGLIGLADDAACTQHEADRRPAPTLDPPGITFATLPFYPRGVASPRVPA